MSRINALVSIVMLASGCGKDTGSVFYINSYHEGYGSSDDITAGIVETLAAANVPVDVFYMDTKRNTGESFIAAKAAEVVLAIRQAAPDVIIASDDNAVKYVIEPNFRDGPAPCVFCGVNWSAEKYGLPTANVTGMIEVLPVEASVALIRRYRTGIDTVAVITENSTSERNSREYIEPMFISMGLAPDYQLVDTFGEWQSVFADANRTADCIFLPTNGAVRGWDDEAAEAFVRNHVEVPVFTCDDFMMPFAVVGLTKVAREQGEWAAQTALRILAGESPADIMVTRNEAVRLYLNQDLAKLIGLSLGEEDLASAVIIE